MRKLLVTIPIHIGDDDEDQVYAFGAGTLDPVPARALKDVPSGTPIIIDPRALKGNMELVSVLDGDVCGDPVTKPDVSFNVYFHGPATKYGTTRDQMQLLTHELKGIARKLGASIVTSRGR